jgi:glycosyltransferase involved in cell wall biosynthesis
MQGKRRILFITIVPSPYQRDLFAALAARDDVELSVWYMESSSPDSPWPEQPLRSFEQILPGFWLPLGGARCHVNWRLPDLRPFDYVVLSSFTSVTGQWLMRRRLRANGWLFWGERLGFSDKPWRERIRSALAKPMRNAKAIVGIGHAAEEDYRRRFPDTRHFCIPYFCDLSEFTSHPAHSGTRRPMTFLFCGQMIRRKGVDLLLTAFERLVAAGLDVRLTLIGREGELPDFLAGLSQDTRARIYYAGFQPPERLPEHFAGATCLSCRADTTDGEWW